MDVPRHQEIERKYDVDETTLLPTLTGTTLVTTTGQPAELKLEATYFDTADLDLARHRTTLRRRTGGDDAGWHLKTPGAKDTGRDTRTELSLPLVGRSRRTAPAKLLEPVRAVVRDRTLAPVVRLSTRRVQYDLLGPEESVVARLCDDHVEAERLRAPVEVQQWREWEVELVDGAPAVLDAVEEQLLAAGAVPASTSSKLARALGDALPPAPDKPSRKKLARGSVAQLLQTHLAEHTARLKAQDAGLRAGRPESVHKLRIAARRLRSALTTYRPLLVPGSTEAVADELRWLGRLLSEPRDAQVLRERLEILVASEPPDLVLGPVASRIDDDLRAAYRAGREHALAALDSERYFRLLDSLDDLVRSPPLTTESEARARDVLPSLLRRDARRLRRAVQDIPDGEDRERRDLALHEARRKAKRLRYAADSAVPVFGGRAKALSRSAKKVQESLGEHQDSVTARRRLRAYGVQAHLSGENGFTFGRLHALEQARATESESSFRAAWEGLPSKRLHRWIRG